MGRRDTRGDFIVPVFVLMLVFVGGIWSLQTSQAGHWLVILCVVVIAAGIAKITKGNKRGRR